MMEATNGNETLFGCEWKECMRQLNGTYVLCAETEREQRRELLYRAKPGKKMLLSRRSGQKEVTGAH
jgi:hypothetical protein